MFRVLLVLVGGFVLVLGTEAQAQSSCNTYGQVDVVSCVSTMPAPSNSNDCNIYGQVNVCLREGTLRTNDGRVRVDVSSRNFISNSANSNIDVEVRTDKNYYRTFDSLEIHVTLNRDGYLYLYNVDSLGKITMLFPNRSASQNYISRGSTTFPRPNASYYFQLNGQTGEERIIAIASTNPNFDLSSATNYQSRGNFATSDNLETFGTALYKGIELVTVQSNVGFKEWDTDTVVFQHTR